MDPLYVNPLTLQHPSAAVQLKHYSLADAFAPLLKALNASGYCIKEAFDGNIYAFDYPCYILPRTLDDLTSNLSNLSESSDAGGRGGGLQSRGSSMDPESPMASSGGKSASEFDSK
jgi:hypothetical protein